MMGATTWAASDEGPKIVGPTWMIGKSHSLFVEETALIPKGPDGSFGRPHLSRSITLAKNYVSAKTGEAGSLKLSMPAHFAESFKESVIQLCDAVIEDRQPPIDSAN